MSALTDSVKVIDTFSKLRDHFPWVSIINWKEFGFGLPSRANPLACAAEVSSVIGSKVIDPYPDLEN